MGSCPNQLGWDISSISIVWVEFRGTLINPFAFPILIHGISTIVVRGTGLPMFVCGAC